MDETAQAHYATVERTWDSSRPVHALTGPDEFRRIAAEVCVRLQPGGTKLLDVGCGTGELIKVLSETGMDCQGFDFAQTKVARAVAMNPGKAWKQGFLEPFAGAPYDRIISYAVCQYCRPVDFSVLVQNTIDALAPGGQAVHFAVPIFELYTFANGVYFNASTEAELDGCRRKLITSALESRPIFDDGTFFHSREKVREFVTAQGHTFAAYPSRTAYRLDLEIIRRG